MYSYLLNDSRKKGLSTFIIRLVCNIHTDPSVSQVLKKNKQTKKNIFMSERSRLPKYSVVLCSNVGKINHIQTSRTLMLVQSQV